MKVTIYTKPKCPPCSATKKKFDQLGIPHEEVAASEWVDHLHRLGYTSTPVIEVDLGDGATVHWSGYRPDQIAQLKDTL